jgi:NAD+ kinase
MKIEIFGIVSNSRKKEIVEVMSRVISFVPEGVRIVALEDTSRLLEGGRLECVASLSECDAIVSLGGDGTFLRAARLVEDDEIPVLGIKIRSLGFLTEDDPEGAISDLFSGKSMIQERMRLESVKEDDENGDVYTALNDIVIHGIGVSRVLHLMMSIGGTTLGEYLADGLIVSTPTGSTAYSLAAGGPIINPVTLESFILTPLCPHSLSVRPIVISSEETLTIELVEGGDSMMTIDGQQACRIREGDRIRIGRSDKVTKMLVTDEYDFYDLLRRKLKWGGVLRKR